MGWLKNGFTANEEIQLAVFNASTDCWGQPSTLLSDVAAIFSRWMREISPMMCEISRLVCQITADEETTVSR